MDYLLSVYKQNISNFIKIPLLGILELNKEGGLYLSFKKSAPGLPWCCSG